jgi:c-di-GMP-binding flagellar brake protein YcgR
MTEEKRKHARVPIFNAISYVCLDEDGNPNDEGMGTTVNVSQGGVMIETIRSIESKNIILMTVDQNKNMLEIKGRVVHTLTVGPTKHLAGIRFEASPEAIKSILKHFITEYHRQKKK